MRNKLLHKPDVLDFPSTLFCSLTVFSQDIDINKEYGNYSITTRQSLEAWSAAELDLSLVCTSFFAL
jgi:ATP-dependent RNA helicase DHX36